MPLIGVDRPRRACAEAENEASEMLPEHSCQFFHLPLLECMGAGTSAEGPLQRNGAPLRPVHYPLIPWVVPIAIIPVHAPCHMQEYGEASPRMSLVRSPVVKSHKQHRYVSRLGPFTQPWPPNPATAHALAVAENEGWPVVESIAEQTLTAYRLLRGELASAVLRR
jgi:hypothetical protein